MVAPEAVLDAALEFPDVGAPVGAGLRADAVALAAGPLAGLGRRRLRQNFVGEVCTCFARRDHISKVRWVWVRPGTLSARRGYLNDTY